LTGLLGSENGVVIVCGGEMLLAGITVELRTR
jgi:hypothetical protein